MKKIDGFFLKAMQRDRRVRSRLTESAASPFFAAWQESYSWLLNRRNNVYDLPADSVIKLKLDALIGILEKVRVSPDATDEAISANVETLVSELNSMDADEEPGETKDFIKRTIEAFRSVAYNANQGASREIGDDGPISGGLGIGGGGVDSDMGDNEGGDIDTDVDTEENDDNIPADLGIEDESDEDEDENR